MTEKSPVPNKKVSADWFFHGALTKIGDTIDRFTGRRWTPSSTIATSEIVERLKRLLDAEARDIAGKGLVIPHNLRLLVQWDKFATDGDEALKKLENELLIAAADHINDRLYYTMSPLRLEVKPDYFVDGVKLSASFDSFTEVRHEAELNVTLPSINASDLLPVASEPARIAHSIYVARFVLNGVPKDRRLEIKAGDRIAVGRTATNQLPIDDPSVSKAHASIVADAEGVLSVADTGSTNGTFVNGERIAYGKAIGLTSGDRVKFGNVEVVFDHVETIVEEPAIAEPDPTPAGVVIDGIEFIGRTSSSDASVQTNAPDMEDTANVGSEGGEPKEGDR